MVDLAGLVLRVELVLRLIPPPDDPGARDLVFDVMRDGLDTALPPVRPLALEGGEARMGAGITGLDAGTGDLLVGPSRPDQPCLCPHLHLWPAGYGAS